MMILLLILLGISVYVNMNAYIKIKKLENELESVSSIETDCVTLVHNLLITYIEVLSKLKRLDRLGSFESDDEVGFVFKTIKNTIEELKNELDDLNKMLNNDSTFND